MSNDNLMDLIFDKDIPIGESSNSLFNLIDDDANTEPIDFSYQTSESLDPEEPLFTEIQHLNIIED